MLRFECVCVFRGGTKVFEEILSEQQASPITGVLIVQKSSVVHLVEASPDASTAFLRQLQSMQTEEEPAARLMESVSVNFRAFHVLLRHFMPWVRLPRSITESSSERQPRCLDPVETYSAFLPME